MDTLLNNGHKSPWDRSEFKKLAINLGKQQTAIRYIETAHHAAANNLGMAEAIAVEEHWRTKLQPALDTCFRLSREYLILHGGLSALRAPAPAITLPEGHKAKVTQIPLQILGRAAALSDGRTAAGGFEPHYQARRTIAPRSQNQANFESALMQDS